MHLTVYVYVCLALHVVMYYCCYVFKVAWVKNSLLKLGQSFSIRDICELQSRVINCCLTNNKHAGATQIMRKCV